MSTTCQEPTSQSNANATPNGEAGASSSYNNNNGRDGNGRFTKGNAGGPGNPFARQAGRLRKVLLECVTEEAMANIVGVLVMLAKGGDLQAIKLLFQYTLGKPAEAINPDRLDVDEAERFEETAAMQKGLVQSALAPDPELALEMVRALRPALAKSSAGRYLGLVDADAAAEREQADAELRQAIRAEQRREKTRARRAEAQSPTTNGLDAGPPSTNGVKPGAPSAYGSSELGSGSNGHGPAPSTNGDRQGSEVPLPSTNGKNGRKEAGQPSANEKKALAQQMSDLLRMLMGRNGQADRPPE